MLGSRRAKVIVIDDNEEWTRLLCSVLAERYDVLGAFSGKEGLELARNILPDLIFCDILMPGITGVEVLRALYQDQRLRGCQIVMMTANQLDAATVALFKQHPNVRGYIRKPCSITELLDTAAHVLSTPNPRLRAEPARRPAASKVHTVLIVDDDLPFVQLLGLVISREDKAYRASNGSQAAEWFKQGGMPNLIILDLMMPSMSGIELLRFLKGNPAWAEIPVLVVTAAVMPERNKTQLMKEFPGVRGVLDKPCDLKALQRAVDSILIRDIAG